MPPVRPSCTQKVDQNGASKSLGREREKQQRIQEVGATEVALAHGELEALVLLRGVDACSGLLSHSVATQYVVANKLCFVVG